MWKVHTISTRAQFAPDLPLPDLVRVLSVLRGRVDGAAVRRVYKDLAGHSNVRM